MSRFDNLDTFGGCLSQDGLSSKSLKIRYARSGIPRAFERFLDVSLPFAQSQTYLLSLRGETLTKEIHQQATEAFAVYRHGIERALSSGTQFIASDQLSLADICFVAELALFMRETAYHHHLEALDVKPVLCDRTHSIYPKVMAHFGSLCGHEAFKSDIEPYLRDSKR